MTSTEYALESSSPMTPSGVGLGRHNAQPTVAMGLARALVDTVSQAGVSRAAFLAEAGLTPSRLNATAGKSARISRRELYRLTALALRHTGDPALGLHWAESVSDRTFAPLSHLIAHASTLKRGFQLLAEYFPLLSDQVTYKVVEQDREVVLRATLPPGRSLVAKHLTAELTLAGFWGFVRSFHPDALPTEVNFAYSAPAHREEYTRCFGGKERFDQPFTGIVFDRALLDAASPHRDDEVREAMQQLAERRLRRLVGSTPYAAQVQNHLVAHGSPRSLDMKTVAKALELSERSLRRRLAAEGKAYDEILQASLRQVAERLLVVERRSIQEAAYALGFSDASTFHRAFKRWTGMTPSDFIALELKPSPSN